MTIDFSPQFHRRLSTGGGRGVWVAVPHPKTLIPVKTLYYRAWQREECMRLTQAGERVLGSGLSQ